MPRNGMASLAAMANISVMFSKNLTASSSVLTSSTSCFFFVSSSLTGPSQSVFCFLGDGAYSYHFHNFWFVFHDLC